jgi:hypothetical protein
MYLFDMIHGEVLLISEFNNDRKTLFKELNSLFNETRVENFFYKKIKYNLDEEHKNIYKKDNMNLFVRTNEQTIFDRNFMKSQLCKFSSAKLPGPILFSRHNLLQLASLLSHLDIKHINRNAMFKINRMLIKEFDWTRELLQTFIDLFFDCLRSHLNLPS